MTVPYTMEKSDYYYINRGLESGGTKEGLTEAILNKKVTLHLYKFKFGIESEHVSSSWRQNYLYRI